MALGITVGSLVSAVADSTGDDSPDAQAKLIRLVNEKGPDFCNITDWPFLRSDLTFNITSANYKYSGAGYLPATFKRIIAAYTLFNNEREPLDEVGIGDAYAWENPSQNSGRPDEFCITRNESEFFEIAFNRLPDQTYGVYLEMELQWAEVTLTTETMLITKQFYGAFALFTKMARFNQQGDTEGYTIANGQWFNGQTGRGVLVDALSMLKSPNKKAGVRARMGRYFKRTGDYDKEC